MLLSTLIAEVPTLFSAIVDAGYQFMSMNALEERGDEWLASSTRSLQWPKSCENTYKNVYKNRGAMIMTGLPAMDNRPPHMSAEELSQYDALSLCTGCGKPYFLTATTRDDDDIFTWLGVTLCISCYYASNLQIPDPWCWCDECMIKEELREWEEEDEEESEEVKLVYAAVEEYFSGRSRQLPPGTG